MRISVMMETPLLEIQLFGSFGVWLEGQPLPHLRSRTEKWLLMLLALRPGHSLSREWLAATLWPDSETTLGLYNLRRCLTNLRKALGEHSDLLRSPTPQTLCLDRTHVRVDAATFDAAIAEGSLESLEQAVALYRGPLLEECIEEWALTARIEREQAYLAALETLATQAASLNQSAVAVRYLRLTIAADPLREAAHGALMQALADCGDHAAVAQVYRDLRLLLHRELNVEPSAETQALYRSLQQQAKQAVLPPAAPSSAPPRRLPVPLTHLVGRETDIEEVVGWLRKGRLVTLLGSGGVGKTRLAIAAAEAVAPEFASGVWFVELASLTDPALVAHTVARTLGVKEEAGRPLVETLVSAIGARSLLLILDNCEHLLDACASVADALLGRCGALRVLATSREALGLVGEHRYHTPSLALPPVVSEGSGSNFAEKEIAWMMEYGGMRLFVERAMQVQPSFRLTPQNAGTVLGVVQDLDGIPLAIELAAARVRSLSIGEIRTRLHESFALLTGGSRTALPRQQTLRALIDWSYDLLTEREKRLLRRLSVFAGGWSLEAAEDVCAERDGGEIEGAASVGKGASLNFPLSANLSTTLTANDVMDVLTALVDKSLVLYEGEPGAARYRLLETVRQYARERLLESGEAAVWRGRHRDFFLALAEEADKNLKGPEQRQWLNRLETEHDNLRQAMTLCLEAVEGSEIGLKLGVALQRFWEVRGHVSEGRECLTALLTRPEAREASRLRAEALNGAGRLTFDLGDYDCARSLHEESLAIFRELGDQQGVASSLVRLGVVAAGQSSYASARSFYEESLAIFKELGDRQGTAHCLNNLGVMICHQGDFVSARSLHEECLAIRRELGDQNGIASSFVNLGVLAFNIGHYASARPLYEESLAIFREMGDRSGIALCLTNLAPVALRHGDFASARSLEEESLQIWQELGDRKGTAHCLSNLGEIAWRQGDYATARSINEKCVAIFSELGDRQGLAYALGNLGEVVSRQCDYAAARSYYAQSLVILQDLGDGQGIARSLEAFASLNSGEDKHETAAQLWGAAQRLREEIEAPMLPGEQEEQDRDVAKVRAALGEQDFMAAWAEGHKMTMEQTITHALADGR